MSKYSKEFKVMVVQEYLEGKTGATLLARKYNIASSGLLRSWIRAYKVKGVSAFQKNEKKNYSYTTDFKENAVQLYLTGELTYEEVSNRLGIPTLGLLFTWVNQFRMYGEIPKFHQKKLSNGLKSLKNSFVMPRLRSNI